MTNDLLDEDALAVYDDPFEKLGFRFASASYEPETRQFHVALKNGLEISFPREKLGAAVFATASDDDFKQVELSEWSVYFPRIDEGFSLEPLAFGDFGNAPWDSKFLAAFKSGQQERLTAA